MATGPKFWVQHGRKAQGLKRGPRSAERAQARQKRGYLRRLLQPYGSLHREPRTKLRPRQGCESSQDGARERERLGACLRRREGRALLLT